MWYQSLKTRQTVKRIYTRNSRGTAVALEYIDKKIEVHHLTREASPLVFDEGSGVIFVAPRDGCLMLIAVNVSAKGKSTYEFRAWELTSSMAFVQRDITVESLVSAINYDSKSKALLDVPEILQHNNNLGLRTDALDDVFVVVFGVCCAFMWKCAKSDSGGIDCKIVTKVSSSMPAIDVILMKPLEDHLSASLLVGESGGMRLWEEIVDSEPVTTFKDTFYPIQAIDAGTSLVTCQEFQRIHKGACVFSNNVGNLYLFMSSRVINLKLPISFGGHGLFAVESVDEKCNKVTLAVISKGHTINLYYLEDIQRLADTCEELSPVPNHVLLSTQTLGAISFLNKSSLVACSSSSRTLSLWVGF